LIKQAITIWGRVLVNDPYIGKEELALLGCKKTSRENLLEESNLIALHLLANEETIGIISQSRLG
jgi:phosphoglycerate dehydrogenase-like enzyme